MLAKGNGDAHVCAVNLLRTVRGEVPYARTKGISREHFDAPLSTEAEAMLADAKWVLGAYEPRLSADAAAITALDEIQGDFNLSVDAK